METYKSGGVGGKMGNMHKGEDEEKKRRRTGMKKNMQ